MLNVIINPKHRRLSLPSRLSVPLTAQKDREYHLSDVCVNDSPLTRARGEDQIGDWISWAASCHSNRPRPHVFIAISLNIIWMSELYKTCHEEINFDRNPTLPAPPPPRNSASCVVMMNLALSDGSFSLTLPLRLAYYFKEGVWVFPDWLCRICVYGFYVNLYTR